MYMYKTLYLQSKKHHLEESGWEEEFNSLFPYKQIESGNTHVKKPRNILHKKNLKLFWTLIKLPHYTFFRHYLTRRWFKCFVKVSGLWTTDDFEYT